MEAQRNPTLSAHIVSAPMGKMTVEKGEITGFHYQCSAIGGILIGEFKVPSSSRSIPIADVRCEFG